jgi:outer membrane protein W
MRKIALSLLLASSALFAKGYEMKLATQALFMDYKEYSRTTGELLDSEKSDLSNRVSGLETGILKNFNYRTNNHTQIAYNLSYVKGNSEYKGSYIGSSSGYGSVIQKTLNTIVDTDLAIKEYFTQENSAIYIGAGAGYRYWKRELSSIQVEDYKWFYLKAQLGVDFALSDKFDIGVGGYYEYAISPTMKANDISEEFKLGGVNTVGVNIPLTYHISKNFDVYLENVYEQQKITESNYVTSGGNMYYEPRSTSKDYYLKIGVKVRF